MKTPAPSPNKAFSLVPEAQGLYDPAHEKDACGLAMIATLTGEASHDIVTHALTALRRLEHRGAVGADEGTGDGAGILLQIPDEFLRQQVAFELPAAREYVVGTAFLPNTADAAAAAQAEFAELVAAEGLTLYGWRDLPVDAAVLGATARSVMPIMRQVFFGGAEELDQKAFRIRRRAGRQLGIYFPSLSSKTIVYKGMVSTAQLEPFYPDLSEPDFKTKLAIVHSRFSTNTFPSWPLAQPFRMLAHNGEINTVNGNRNWMRARQSQLAGPLLGRNPEELFPICSPDASDSQSLDEVAEMLLLSGRSVAQTMMMLVPEAWEKHETMPQATRDFYRYHSTFMEPWDGPAAITFTDGDNVGSLLDRNGLRPVRYWITDAGLVVLGSEVGIVDIPDAEIREKGRVSPGKIFYVDTVAGRIVPNDEVKAEVAGAAPWGEWADANDRQLGDLPQREPILATPASILQRQQTFGYTVEELQKIIAPAAKTGAEPLYAMGTDTPIAVLANKQRSLFDYFVQSFAQVTNPPLDSIREELVTSLHSSIGPEGNLLETGFVKTTQWRLKYPVITNEELEQVANLTTPQGTDATLRVRGLYNPLGGEAELRARITEICEKVSAAVGRGIEYIIISDRNSNAQWAPIPSLLLTAAVHHHLLRSATRTRVSLLVEAGDVREVHHVAALIGYGAGAVNPYLVMESVEHLARTNQLGSITPDEAVANLIKALGKGLQKIMSKMGISTVASFRGAQTFEAIGLSKRLIDEYFPGTVSQIDGVDLGVIAAEVKERHDRAYPQAETSVAYNDLETGGEYDYRRDGAPHLFSPENVFKLQHATRTGRYDVFKQYTRGVDDQSEQLMTLRGMFKFKERTPVPLAEVEPVSEIVKRFSTGAMSYGSISQEAHETLAIAMNKLGAKSNTGEGGEDPERLLDPERCSKIKQVASGRFGVTSLYLTKAEDIQIKMAQGAKPGEGGQLMAQKMYPWVAKTRHSTPGVSLISPPPHHDIYSIEDLAQLIYDLKCANTAARVHVKLVSERGVGTVAAGVAKAKADVVLISGHDGGTGAAPLNSLKHAGAPWELGLAEAQQTLLLNGLRNRVVVQADGQLKTGRDVVIAALLGAEEFGFATAPLVVAGCIMMRKCHLDTCPVGIATQNPDLRARYTGQAEHIINFFEFIAEEVREHLAALGFRSIDEAVGHAEVLDTAAAEAHWKAQGLDLSKVLYSSAAEYSADEVRCTQVQDHELEQHCDRVLIAEAQQALATGAATQLSLEVVNTDRAVGTMLGHEITKRYDRQPLAADTITVRASGHAGQSFGAFIPQGLTLELAGEANDYVGKGLSGGRIIVHPTRDAQIVAHENVIAGNVIGYGATSGELFINGIVGERFLVRNSGATAVVEGIGDHGLEYMTGGVAVILGATGRNLGAGMSGGYAFVLDLDTQMLNKEARESGELEVLPLDADLQLELRELLQQHERLTGSAQARTLLADFAATSARFSLLRPRMFARVLEIRAAATAAGTDPDAPQVWQEILEVSQHG